MWSDPRDHKIVGAVLAEARRRSSITQQDLARRLGKPQSFISDFERGQRRIDIVEFLVITRTLGVDPVVILTEIATAIPG